VIVCWRTVCVPQTERERFAAWIEDNRRLRQEHGILFEFVLERSTRQGPAKTLQPPAPESSCGDDLVVVTAWASHEAFDAWIATPDRDRLTDSQAHRSVEYRPITRYDVVGGYLNPDGLSGVAESQKEES
jgi:hypothetical protein